MDPSSPKTALITGASAGLGAEFARAYAARGHNLVLVARRLDRLEQLGRELEQAQGVRALALAADLVLPDAADELARRVDEAGMRVDVLVNNAGYAVGGHFVDNDWPRHADFLQVMVTAVAHLTHLFVPGMVQRGYGRVINVSSLAALIPGSAGHTLYGAAKAFLVKMSESLSLELAGTGVQVTASCPGFTYTEFHDVLGNRDQVSRLPRWMWMEAGPVVESAIEAVERGDAVSVPGGANKTIAGLTGLLPRGLAMKLMSKQSSKVRSQES